MLVLLTPAGLVAYFEALPGELVALGIEHGSLAAKS
jgi:hypothetical protein